MPGLEGEPVQDFLQKKLAEAARILKDDYDPERVTSIFLQKSESEIDALVRGIDRELFDKPSAARQLTIRRWMMKQEEQDKTRAERKH